ncbi:hypothetical protein V8B55DRAFT_1571957 [Mucor lusitanicus]|uniref:Uncharacterized protein n=1 Tax=Mucor circinelloides f. lusitanicus TaxID=29924 RepID=A0A8H4BGT2_MUCCL|nr:hypothetical protein FB192DRAFT_1100676 [Mucor lusitanicus]
MHPFKRMSHFRNFESALLGETFLFLFRLSFFSLIFNEHLFGCVTDKLVLFFSGTPGVDISFVTSGTVFFSLSQARQESIFPLSLLALSSFLYLRHARSRYFLCHFWHCLLFFISGTPGVDISFVTSGTVFEALV